ncbi:MAG: hypothetical protein A2268_07010 [Candidatus Raymondbacteria bacterium RifOxyA12_full_50_37]|uniref:Outer membrane protein beta-barrel domain-containing protein n=1 Tax=Candidatus Raymondbacteria bacterium RIFOXYD12_FULL_49_13 TaxID=1817890 RepID=A0A1F7FEX9_UNCRA|nr:MAG: hypothetical protein A2268_07010 [Candidatus Raymondbacteria bacterium RifOxyA12_full_50_37]OGJ91134.1 MAG: hypothetical protein A2248_01160 [Candidatus Raymondbacteria bacterium RIFOXYA2_FULL_49_16]OGJ97532.1 MAG: hypothetical protein A2453_01925 [Candidatus Raymondbacteria bacterium RIFOXYC2_FULL_50_21]OGK00164.1 MAG: hypothetical protein A2350_16375 [Candidatus Raymondbacteria bacterium RifOxyB12_full_50_8]OGK05006.1 MAG: hypothetical protein A2519_10035 [Candidatus Raymondbacteria b
MIMKIFFVLVFSLIYTHNIFGDVVIFPFQLAGVDSSNQNTIIQLFFEDYETFYKGSIKAGPDSVLCSAKECAIATASAMGAEEVVYGSARMLGSKWIVAGYRYRTADQKLLASIRLDCKSVEDFEFVMKRMAEALAKGKTMEDVASIDNVTESEMTDEQHRRREGFYAFGVKFGYLFPQGKSSYLNYDYNYDYYYSYEDRYDTNQYKQVLMTDFVNWFELPKDLVLNWDLHVGWGAELGTHFSLLKLFSRGDFAPYAGGGIGLDYVFADPFDDPNKRNSGFALNGKVGMLFFRTYNFRLSLDAGYKIVFNDDLDQGITTALGITWKKRPPSETTQSRNPVTTVLAVIGGIVVTIFVIGVAL